MEDGPPIFKQDFSCPALLIVLPQQGFRVRGYHPLWHDFPVISTNSYYVVGTGLFPGRSPLLGKSRLISFPRGTEMFQFSRFASFTYVFNE